MNLLNKYFATLFLLLVLGSCQLNKKPNVLFILVDDLGWTDLGCYGSDFYDTPHLDALARQSILFTNAYAASPVCSPTRAAIMTGKHPARLNITDWIPGMSSDRAQDPMLIAPEDVHNLPLQEITLAETFRNAGYKTFFAGKWHLGEMETHWPTNHGFDVNKGGNAWGAPQRSGKNNGYYSPYGNPRLSNGPEGEYLTDRLTDESIRFIDSIDEAPFLLYLAFYTVHTPIQGCNKYDEYYQGKSFALPDSGRLKSEPEHQGLTRINQSNAKYAAMVRSLDANVGRILAKLEESGKAENTVIVFTSDNGGLSTLRNPGPTSVRPLRAGKGWCYEGGIRVPLIIKYPNMQDAGKKCDIPVTSMDFYPTLLDLAGLPSLPDQHQDGKSLQPMLINPSTDNERELVWHYPHYHGSTWRPGSAIRVGNYKLITFYENNSIELYDLSKDLSEQHDLTASMPKKAKQLQSLLHEKLAEMNAKYPVANN